jgi:hypothetical protein
MKYHIEKNYFYNDETKALYRIITDNKHLIWRPEYRGLAAFNADIYNKYRNRCTIIGWITRIKGKPSYKYSMPILSSNGFDFWKEEIRYREPQYIVRGLSSWKCEEIKANNR